MSGIEDILSSISDEDMASIKALADSLLSSDGGSGGASDSTAAQGFGGAQEEVPFDFADAETVNAVISVMKRLKSRQDNDRIKLLRALKPLLSDKRRQRTDDAIKMLSLFEILPELKNLNLF